MCLTFPFHIDRLQYFCKAGRGFSLSRAHNIEKERPNKIERERKKNDENIRGKSFLLSNRLIVQQTLNRTHAHFYNPHDCRWRRGVWRNKKITVCVHIPTIFSVSLSRPLFLLLRLFSSICRIDEFVPPKKKSYLFQVYHWFRYPDAARTLVFFSLLSVTSVYSCISLEIVELLLSFKLTNGFFSPSLSVCVFAGARLCVWFTMVSFALSTIR